MNTTRSASNDADRFLFPGGRLLHEYERSLTSVGNAKSTIALRVGDVARFAKATGRLLDARPKDLCDYFAAQGTEWSKAYRKTVTTSLKKFYRWAHSNDLIDQDPAATLPTITVPRATGRPIPEHVVLEAFHDGTLHERAIVALGSTMGLRRTEIATLHPCDRTGRRLSVIGKGQKRRSIPLDDLTLNILLELETEQGQDSYYFPGRFGGHVHSATIYRWFKRLIPDWKPHNMRHRACTRALETTKDIAAVAEFMGHESWDTTRIYVKVSDEAITAVANASSLVYAQDSRRIAGLSPDARLAPGEHEKLLNEISELSRRASRYGMSLSLRAT